MTEATFRRILVDLCRYQPDIKLQPIESSRTSIGIPDIFFRTQENEGWIELKQIIYNRIISVPFRPKQLEWLREYTELGGCAILATIFQVDQQDYVSLFKDYRIKTMYSDTDFVLDSFFTFPIHRLDTALLIKTLNFT